jgi:hypothetical protein
MFVEVGFAAAAVGIIALASWLIRKSRKPKTSAQIAKRQVQVGRPGPASSVATHANALAQRGATLLRKASEQLGRMSRLAYAQVCRASARFFDFVSKILGLFRRDFFELRELGRLPQVNEAEWVRPFLKSHPHNKDQLAPSFAV